MFLNSPGFVPKASFGSKLVFGMSRDRGTDLSDDAVAAVLDVCVPASCFREGAPALWDYPTLNMKAAPRWQALARHRVVLGDLLLATQGRRLLQHKWEKQVTFKHK